MIIGKTRTNQPVESDAGFDAQVEEVATDLIEGGDIDNAKPIYFHPILIRDNAEGHFARITCVILDNNPTAYTIETFKTKVKELMDNDAIIQVNGCFTRENICYNAFNMAKSGENYIIYGNDYQGNQRGVDIDNTTYFVFSDLTDGVNKIN